MEFILDMIIVSEHTVDRKLILQHKQFQINQDIIH